MSKGLYMYIVFSFHISIWLWWNGRH